MKSLEEFFNKWESKENSYMFGQNDCAMFVAEAYNLITGKDYMPLFKGKYGNKEELDLWFKENNYINLEDAITQLSGVPAVEAIEAKYGDIVSIVDKEASLGIGICRGAKAHFLNKEGCIVKVPLRMCNKSWSIN